MVSPIQGTPPATALAAPLDTARLKERVAVLSAAADEALRQNLRSHVSYIEEVSQYTIFSGGKRLRPVLFMLASMACGGDGEPRLAALFEYLHAATLLHDDVIDEAGLRRGRPAARKVYGNEAVILVGDFLFTKSYSLAADVPDRRFITALTDCTTHIAEGQVLELLRTDQLELSAADYLEVIVAKTAVLLAAACQMGAIHAGAADKAVEAFYRYGLNLGVAFQLVDDALDYVGTQHEFGKPVGHDLAEGKITLPLIHARDGADTRARAELLDLVARSRREPDAVARAKELIVAAGGVNHTFAWAAAYAAQALEALGELPAASSAVPEMTVLGSLPAYVLTRRH